MTDKTDIVERLDTCPEGMVRLIEMSFAVDQDGEDFHVRNSTRIPDGITWADAFYGARQIADDLARQMAERFNCPYHPKNIKEAGEPVFADGDAATILALRERLAKAEDLLRRIAPHVDAIVCYASTMGEHEPNRTASDVRAYFAALEPKQ